MASIELAIGDEVAAIEVRPGVLGDVGGLIASLIPTAVDSKVLVVSDRRVASLYSATVIESLERADLSYAVHEIEPGEASKNLGSAESIYETLSRHSVGRDGVVLALGGGVVSDLAGFVAATWMRGIRFAICPTTLEAAIDAAIGGKTAVNVAGGKNLVGAFHQATLVAVDPNCLSTLDLRDRRAGMAESIKHALIDSPEFFDWHEEHVQDVLELKESVVTDLLERNIRIKADIVTQDPFETTGKRMLLNLGHTIGHAIEACCGYSLRHGECVGLGLLAACRLSQSLDLIDQSIEDRVRRLLDRFGLPTKLSAAIDTEQIMDTIARDKKSRGGRVRFVLLEGIGTPTIRDDVPDGLVKDAYHSLLPT